MTPSNSLVKKVDELMRGVLPVRSALIADPDGNAQEVDTNAGKRKSARQALLQAFSEAMEEARVEELGAILKARGAQPDLRLHDMWVVEHVRNRKAALLERVKE